ncbi:hypothetical protein DFQ14_103103 [Halopolyspora algeriensis]|uniref:Uncharacterized protein n=1 Tax=Halopolyspora algeriensis TaxID=1500506 RepID=A0A368VTQ2_9ACTN|nr:hypothetical protein [Halopolyspora algeriensis]RCW45139.1 hypothetical protein DFQ14_103103 [Halopolyspora algeriensis]TQM53140.1 hypothetical protein FHU43_2521 [Halopolyspora algeriensis]
MPIPDPWADPDSTRAPAHEHAHAHAREAVPQPTESADTAGEVVPFPGITTSQDTDSDSTGQMAPTEQVPLAKRSGWNSAAAVWAVEARETAAAAMDGSVWRARPPSLRDLHARVQRAEWAGDIPALRAVGQWFGYLSLAITAIGYALLWIARRPFRLVLTVLITVLVVVLAI